MASCSSSSSSAPRPSGSAGQTNGSSSISARAATGNTGHVVVLMMENRSYSDVIGNRSAPFLNSLARRGASFTDLHATTHPSEPNYVALFSGSTHGVTDDACPLHLTGPTLAGELRQAGLSFAGYSEGLPSRGSTVCTAGAYARKHAPWTDFATPASSVTLPSSVNLPFTAFPTDLATLPSVSFVIPNLNHDMHDGTIAQADTWTREHLGRYATWASSNHSLLVVTWDEDDHSAGNRIPTVVVGAGVPTRTVGTRVTSYSLLRAIEDRYRLPLLGASATAPTLGLA